MRNLTIKLIWITAALVLSTVLFYPGLAAAMDKPALPALSGYVHNQLTNEPLEGITICLGDYFGQFGETYCLESTRTDAQGYYKFMEDDYIPYEAIHVFPHVTPADEIYLAPLYYELSQLPGTKKSASFYVPVPHEYTKTEEIAHRGDRITSPENTLTAIERAIDKGASYMEIDVFLNADGDVVVAHGSTYKEARDFLADIPTQVYGPTGACWGINIETDNWEQIRSLECDIGTKMMMPIGDSWHPVFREERYPLLKEVFEKFPGYSGWMIELKQTEISDLPDEERVNREKLLGQTVNQLLKDHGLTDVWVTSFSDAALSGVTLSTVKKMRQVSPLPLPSVKMEVNNALVNGYDALNVRTGHLEKFVEFAHRYGLMVSSYTLFEQSLRDHLNAPDKQADFFMTDILDMMLYVNEDKPELNTHEHLFEFPASWSPVCRTVINNTEAFDIKVDLRIADATGRNSRYETEFDLPGLSQVEIKYHAKAITQSFVITSYAKGEFIPTVVTSTVELPSSGLGGAFRAGNFKEEITAHHKDYEQVDPRLEISHHCDALAGTAYKKGQPFEGVRICLADGTISDYQPRCVAETTTNKYGSYSFRQIPASAAWVLPLGPQFNPAKASLLTEVLPPYGITLADFSLMPQEWTKTEEVAHRGDRVTSPDNSYIAVERAVDKEASYVQLDVFLNVDDEVVVSTGSRYSTGWGESPDIVYGPTQNCHNRSIETDPWSTMATCDIGTQMVSHQHETLADLSDKWDPIFADETFPYLDDILADFWGEAQWMIELKATQNDDLNEEEQQARNRKLGQAVQALVEDYALVPDVWVISENDDTLAAITNPYLKKMSQHPFGEGIYGLFELIDEAVKQGYSGVSAPLNLVDYTPGSGSSWRASAQDHGLMVAARTRGKYFSIADPNVNPNQSAISEKVDFFMTDVLDDLMVLNGDKEPPGETLSYSWEIYEEEAYGILLKTSFTNEEIFPIEIDYRATNPEGETVFEVTNIEVPPLAVITMEQRIDQVTFEAQYPVYQAPNMEPNEVKTELLEKRSVTRDYAETFLAGAITATITARSARFPNVAPNLSELDDDWDYKRVLISSGDSDGLPVLKDWLWEFGYEAFSISQTPWADELAEWEIDVLVLWAPENSEERWEVYDFVEAGGGLLLVGEHEGYYDNFENCEVGEEDCYIYDKSIISAYARRFGLSLGESSIGNQCGQDSERQAWPYSNNTAGISTSVSAYFAASNSVSGGPGLLHRGPITVMDNTTVGDGRVVLSGDSNFWGGCDYDNRAMTLALFAWLSGGTAENLPLPEAASGSEVMVDPALDLLSTGSSAAEPALPAAKEPSPVYLPLILK